MAGGFVDTLNQPYGGSLQIDGGAIDRSADPATEWTYTADITGDMKDATGVDFSVDGDLVGQFHGGDAA